jgi:hypothetical protein
METLKKNVNSIANDTEAIVKDYLKLFWVKQSKKLAVILGILASVFILSTLLLIVILFCSFALAVYLNDILPGDYWGFWIVSGFYIVIILTLILRIISTKTPLLANVLVKLLITVLEIDTDQTKNIKGLEHESENLKHNIETSKVKIKANFELLKYVIIETLFKEIVGLFTFKKKKKKPEDSKQGKPSNEKNKP